MPIGPFDTVSQGNSAGGTGNSVVLAGVPISLRAIVPPISAVWYFISCLLSWSVGDITASFPFSLPLLV